MLIGSFLVLSLFTGCQARTVTVDTVLTVDSSWSGSRVMTVAFSAADYPDEQSRAALDGMMARCPSAMTYGKQENGFPRFNIFLTPLSLRLMRIIRKSWRP